MLCVGKCVVRVCVLQPDHLREMWKFLVSEEYYCNNIIKIVLFCNLGVIMQLNTIYNL